jgi:hypothetical protein
MNNSSNTLAFIGLTFCVGYQEVLQNHLTSFLFRNIQGSQAACTREEQRNRQGITRRPPLYQFTPENCPVKDFISLHSKAYTSG